MKLPWKRYIYNKDVDVGDGYSVKLRVGGDRMERPVVELQPTNLANGKGWWEIQHNDVYTELTLILLTERNGF